MPVSGMSRFVLPNVALKLNFILMTSVAYSDYSSALLIED